MSSTQKGRQRAASRAGRQLLTLNLALAGLLLACLLYLFLLRGMGLPFRCVFHDRVHLYCPGCGGTRALEALLRLDVWGALCSNAAVPAALLLLLYYEVALLLAMHGRARVRALPAILFAYFLLAHAILRNLLLVYFHIDYLGDLMMYWS